MDQQRPFLYLSLFFLGFLIWTTWQQKNAPPPAETIPTTSINSTSIPTSVPSATSVPTAAGATTVPQVDTANSAKEKLVHVKTDVLDIYINTIGGTIIQADLPAYPVSLEEKDTAVRIIDKEKDYAAQSGLVHSEIAGKKSSDLAPNHYANFNATKQEYSLEDGQDTIEVPLTWTNNGITVTKTFTFERGNYLVKKSQKVDNNSGNNWSASEYLQLSHAEHTRDGSLLAGDVAYTGAAYYNEKYIKVSFDDISDENLSDTVIGGWAAIIQHYFVGAWIPEKDSENNYYTIFDKAKTRHIIGVKSPLKVIPNGQSDTFNSQFYIGPTDQDSLAEISKGLDLAVDYGIFAFVSKPIFAVMSFINKHIVSNWGWTIILLTMFIKLLFFYPSAMSYKSMAKMKKLGPKIKEIGEKFKNDPQAKQKATMEFYRKEKINPLGGCLPMLIQMPVFMGLYWVLQESVELRQAPWILWYKDLSLKDPFFILPLIMGLSMFIQQKLNPPAVADPMQQKIFTYLPVVFTVMFLFFPAGLVLYWVVNNILSIFQQWFINKKIIGDTKVA
ncbi:MAG: YidC/Oxa1 family membrane protein insertase [Cocleimonas sp.]|jgi:YidC/Oxa1 family membrane protein insertase